MSSIVIIGGGVSGLCAGIFALQKGFKVTIYEKHSTLGGNLTGWKRKGYNIDGCIHWLTGTNSNTSTYKLWQQVGAFSSNDIIKQEVLFTSVYKNQTISLFRDTTKTLKQMLELSISDKDEIIDFISTVEKLKLVMGIGEKYCNKKANIFDFTSLIPKLIKYYNLNLFDLARKFNNQTIRRLFTDFIGGEYSSLAMLVTYATFSGGNGDTIKGGSQNMANNLVKKFTSLGGVYYTNSEVISASVNDKKVEYIQLASGEKVYSDYFIATGDIRFIFSNLLKVKMPSKLERWQNNFKVFSSVNVSLVVDKNLVNFKGDIALPIPQKYQKIIGASRIKLKEYSFDNTFIKNGKVLIQSITFVDKKRANYFIQLKKSERKYKEVKTLFASAIIKSIEEIFPNMKDQISLIDVCTPATYYRYTGNSNGSYMSYVFPKKVLPINCSSKVKGISNFLVASQYLSPTGGLPIALGMASKVVKDIYKLEKKVVKRHQYKMAST